MVTRRSRYDAIVVGAGHNGLVAASYLARAGRSVLVLEALEHVGGAAVSAQVFAGVDARLSRYAYLVSLLPHQIVDELGLNVELRRRRISSYTPVPGVPERGILVDAGDRARTAASLLAATGDARAHTAWLRLSAMTQRVAARVFPTLLEPLVSREEMRARVDDDGAWEPLFERPLGELLESTFADDTVRGIVLTDALIGTFASAHDPALRQNRCLLYHVIGNGTGDWDVPVGGMGAVSGALETCARAGGAEIVTRARVTAIEPGPRGAAVRFSGEAGDGVVSADHVLAGCAPATLARLLGEAPAEPAPEGAQLKVNMLLSRLPRLRDSSVDPREAFAGTFHVNEGYAQLEAAHAQSARGEIPDLPPSEIYCHTLTDPTILGAELCAAGAHTLTLFALHQPARLFAADNERARNEAAAATLRSLNSVLAEPIEDCLWTDGDGRPCIEARTPVDLEAELGLPGGNIFHRDLSWPFAEEAEQVGAWGVATDHESVLLCGAGARRGGGVSGIPGRNAAMAALTG